MNADAVINTYGQIDGMAWALFRNGVATDQARFWIRRLRVSFERRMSEEADPELAATLAKRTEDEALRRYRLFVQAGGAPWDFYPVKEHGQRLRKLLQGVPEADLEEAMTPYLDPIKRDLMRRGFPEDDAEAWCEEIAGESSFDPDDQEMAEWLAQS